MVTNSLSINCNASFPCAIKNLEKCRSSRALMFSVKCKQVNRGHKGEHTKLYSMTSYYVFLGTTGTVWPKSPPNTTILPPKGTFSKHKSSKSISSTSMFSQRAIKASSQMLNEASCISDARLDCLPTLQDKHWPQSIGILNLECVVRPVGILDAAVPELKVGKTICLSNRTFAYNALYKKVFPVPPGPSMKKSQVVFA